MRRSGVAMLASFCLAITGCALTELDQGSAPATSAATAAATKPPGDTPDAQPAAEQLAAALTKFDVTGLPLLVEPAKAQDELTTIFAGMDGYHPSVKVAEISYPEADVAKVTLQHHYDFGDAVWDFTATANLVYTDSNWHVVWKPSILHSGLNMTNRLRHRHKLPKRAPINDNEGLALVEQHTQFQVGLDKGRIDPADWPKAAADLAALLEIDAAAFAKRVQAAGEKQFVVATTLPKDGIIPDIGKVPGADFAPVEVMVAPSNQFAVSLLGVSRTATADDVAKSEGTIFPGEIVGASGLQSRYDQRLRGTPGRQVDLVPREAGTSEEENLFSSEAKPGKPLELSLDRELQTRAEEVLANQQSVAAIVVIDPATGGVLAAANSPAAGSYPQATFGKYSPGSTFKVVSALALLRKGLTPTSKVSCPQSVDVAGHNFTNYSGYPSNLTGDITLTEALAYSCNTAFVNGAAQVTPEELHAAAASLGVGTDYEAGFTSYFGTVAPNSSKIDQAASMIGQGQITMSPLAMASVAASVAGGRTVIPWLVAGEQAESTAAPLTETEAKQLQEMMSATVNEGTGKVLSGLMTGAKTGTAEFGKAGQYQTHAWMIAWNKDVAVAAFVEVGESGSTTAGPLIQQLFKSG